MRRMVSRRSRSRSRTPPVREKPKKIVNMLDSDALSAAKEVRRKPMADRVTGGPNGEPEKGDGPERITCTIEGSGTRRSVFNRVSGGRFEGGGRFGGNRSFDHNRSFEGNRSFDNNNRSFDGNRSFNDRRVNISGDGARRSFPDKRSFFIDRQRTDDNDEFRTRREDGDKPVMKLVDPQEVPRSNRFFTHDDRGGGDNNEWRGRDMYDPRKDTSRYDRSRFDRDRRDRDFGNRRFDRGDERDRRGGGDRGGSGWDGFGRQNVNGYSGSRFGSKSGSDDVWVHDKFLELMDDEDEAKKADEGKEDDGVVLVIDSAKTERTVE